MKNAMVQVRAQKKAGSKLLELQEVIAIAAEDKIAALNTFLYIFL